MKKILMMVFGIFVSLSLLVVTPAFASPNLNFGSQLNSNQCPPGKLVINVNQTVLNDNDSGVAGNAWAFDNYKRLIKVWQISDDTFCALLKYAGQFTTIAGPSPENTDIDGIVAGINGTFEGGYRSTIFTGSLDPSPAHPAKGNIGTFDYECDTAFHCPGYVNWTSFYFSSSSISGFDLEWWGWIYHGGNNGTWVNAISGNSGDITD